MNSGVKRALITAGCFMVAFGVSFAFFHTYDGKNQYENGDFPVGEKTTFNAYMETIDGAYIGELDDEKFWGSGEFDFLSGEIYCGQWKDSKMSGTGTMVFDGVGTYTGEYSDSERAGQGTFTWDNGDQYAGGWQEDMMFGQGTYTFANGDYAEGQFAGNRIQNGTLYTKNAKWECQREIEDGELSSTISIKMISGESYSGAIEDGKLNGQGTLVYKDGSTYIGNFENNQRSGQGCYSWESGAYYDGAWANDQMSGEGTYYYKAKDSAPKLERSFLNGKPNGVCRYYETADTYYKTTWENGQCVCVEEVK